MAGRCTADLASEFAALLPAHVLGDLLGIPERHRPKLFELMETSFGFDEGVSGARRFDATIALYAYIKKLCEKRYEHLEADLVSSILAEAPGGSEMSPMEMAGLVLVLLNAGTATTRNLISLGIRGLLEQRDQFDRLAGDPALISLAVEELLRYTSPLIQFTRTAAVDTELGGKGLAAGSKVVMIFASANRDERRFEDPDRIDVGRKPNEHLAFGGGGPHFCLGAPLARLEAGLAISAIVERLKGLELASSAPMTCFRSTTIHGLRTLPVRWESVVRGTQ